MNKFGNSLRALGAATLALVAISVTASPAAAHHADVTASADCTGAVAFTATAWEGMGTPGSPEWVASRTNPTVEVAWGTGGAGGAFTVLPHKPTYRFGTDNGYTFSDSMTPAPALAAGTVVTVRVRSLAPWGTGVIDAAPRYADATIPAPCTAPTVAITCPTSVVYGTAATYTATPTGDGPFTYQWSLNGAPIAGATANVASITRTAATDAVSVTVTDTHGQTATASAMCAATYPAPTVSVACPHGLVYGQPATFTATVVTNPSNPVTYQWSLNGTPIAGATSATASITVSSATDSVSVTVRDAQTPALTATASTSCMGTPAPTTPPATTPPATTPPPSTPASTTPAPTSPAPAAVPASVAPTATPPVTPAATTAAEATPTVLGEAEVNDETEDDQAAETGASVEGVKVTQIEGAAQLPATGSNSWTLALTALLLLATGVALVLSPRLLSRLR